MDWSKWYFLFVASGVSASKEKAQNQISSGISTTVGATVFNLTLMWGICVIFGTKDMTEKSAAESSSPSKSFKGLSGISFLNLSYWIRSYVRSFYWSLCWNLYFTETGVTIDPKTSKTAGIMLLSLIPLALVQPVTTFNSFFARRILIFITLLVSVMLLMSYFLYQVIKFSANCY